MVRAGAGRSAAVRGILAGGLLWAAVGCAATEENLKKADGYYREGIANLDGNRQEAFVSFQKAIQENPNHRDAHYYVGHIYAVQGKYQLAEEQFRTVLGIRADYSEAWTYLGQVLVQQDRWQEAIRAYREALTNPLYATPDVAWFNLGRALLHEGDGAGAARAFEDALLVSPPNVPSGMVRLELGRAYHRAGDDAKARAALTQAIESDKGGDYAAEASKLLDRLKR